MANHRAPRRPASRTGSTDGLAAPRVAAATVAGKRRAEKPSRIARTRPTPEQTPRPSRLLPSTPSVVGAAALVLAATGAVTVTQPTEGVAAATAPAKGFVPASAFTGTSVETSSLQLDSRTQAVSRDSQRTALSEAAGADEALLQAVEAQAEERNAALAQLAASAERYAGQIAANAWRLPLTGYRLTARFGHSSSLWATTHTGLDFAAPTGTPVVSVANGVVRSAGYDGSYGYKVVIAHEDGTETWYAHLSTMTVSPGESVIGGKQIGTVGSTGNSTGPHLHFEVRPGAGDPVDPYAALIARGVAL